MIQTDPEIIQRHEDGRERPQSALPASPAIVPPHIPQRVHVGVDEQMRRMIGQRLDSRRVERGVFEEPVADRANKVQGNPAQPPAAGNVLAGDRILPAVRVPVEIPPPFWAYLKNESVIGVTDGIVYAGCFAEYNCQAFEVDASGFDHGAVVMTVSVDPATGVFDTPYKPIIEIVAWVNSGPNNVYGTQNSISSTFYDTGFGHKPFSSYHGLQCEPNTVKIILAEVWTENGKITKIRRRWNGGDIYVPVTAARYIWKRATGNPAPDDYEDMPAWRFEASLMNCDPMIVDNYSPLSFAEIAEPNTVVEEVGSYTEQQMAPRFE